MDDKLYSIIKRQTADFSKDRGIVSCTATQESDVMTILNNEYNMAVIVRRHAGNIQIKYGGRKS